MLRPTKNPATIPATVPSVSHSNSGPADTQATRVPIHQEDHHNSYRFAFCLLPGTGGGMGGMRMWVRVFVTMPALRHILNFLKVTKKLLAGGRGVVRQDLRP